MLHPKEHKGKAPCWKLPAIPQKHRQIHAAQLSEGEGSAKAQPRKWQCRLRRETVSIPGSLSIYVLIDIFPGMKLIFAAIGEQLCNRKKKTLPLCWTELWCVPCLRNHCGNTAVTQGNFLILSYKYPFPLCCSTKQWPKAFYPPGSAVCKAMSWAFFALLPAALVGHRAGWATLCHSPGLSPSSLPSILPWTTPAPPALEAAARTH